MPKSNFSPQQIAAALGKDFPPTEEQAHVIEGPFSPKLVVAGAGAGKTETMASRGSWVRRSARFACRRAA